MFYLKLFVAFSIPTCINTTLDQVLKDEEGVQIMKILGKNMVWILKSIEAGKMNNVM